MGANSKIQWTHHTFNPWWGCHKVSPGCKHCYAEAFSKRVGRAIWGPTSERWLPSDAYWKQLAKWNREAVAAGERHRVFVASMADVGEVHEVPEINTILDRERARLWEHIAACPQLDFLLTTKRPENFAKIVPQEWMTNGFPLNVWVIVTAEDQQHLELRVPHLLALPVRAVRGLSCEPLLGPLDMRNDNAVGGDWNWLSGENYDHSDGTPAPQPTASRIDWVIVGGESGHGARPFDIAWARSIRDQCKGAGVACFIKQLGKGPYDGEESEPTGNFRTHEGKRQLEVKVRGLTLRDPKGGDWLEWPEDLRVREFPMVKGTA